MHEELDAKGGMAAVMRRVEDTATAVRGLESVLDSQTRSQARHREEVQENLLLIQRIVEGLSAKVAGNGGAAEVETTRAYRLP
jgi:hypothetical protein